MTPDLTAALEKYRDERADAVEYVNDEDGEHLRYCPHDFSAGFDLAVQLFMPVVEASTGCSNHGCHVLPVQKQTGMRTNGRCKCRETMDEALAELRRVLTEGK